MSRVKIVRQHFRNAFVGWLAGVATTLIVGLLWPIIFPAFIRVDHYYGAGPSVPIIMAIVLVVASPAAALGGLIGGSLAIEGGDRGRRMIAILVAIVLSLPCSAWGYWFFTGY